MNCLKHATWAVRILLIVLMFLVGAGFYAFSGLPMPWAKVRPEARERAEYNRFSAIAKLAKASAVASGHEGPLDGRKMKALMTEQGMSTESIQFVSPKGDLGSVVLMGEKEDANGMVWAVTSAGCVVKVNPVVH